MKQLGYCMICGRPFERDEKDRKKLGCGECGDTPEQMAKSMFLSSRSEK